MDRKNILEEVRHEIQNKRALYFIVLIITLILVMTMFIQFRTVEMTDIETLQTLREVELRTEIASFQKKTKEIESKLGETEQKISEYNKELKNKKSAPELIKKELKQAEEFLGYTEITGRGMVLNLSDRKNEIDSMDILLLINQLKGAGAEAISVNDERIISNSEVVTVNGNLIYINGRKQTSPYTIKAIGDEKELENALTTKGGIVNEMKLSNKEVIYNSSSKLIIPKYKGEIINKYIK